jgi:hypothetical protein
MSASIDSDVLQKVLARATTDVSYRRKLMRNPHLGIKEVSGAWPSTMLRIKVVEREPDVDVLLVLPDAAADAVDELPVQPSTVVPRASAPDAADVIMEERAIRAADVWQAPVFTDREALMRASIEWAPANGLVVEFGVFQGESLRYLQHIFDAPVIGYDSFDGLPEAWERSPGHALPAGFFQCRPPAIDRAELVVGRFEDTVARDLARRAQPIRLAHIDCDLYSSAATVLAAIRPWLQPGTVLLFDELAAFETSAYQNWRDGEWRALQESGLRCRPLGRTLHTQCAVAIDADR